MPHGYRIYYITKFQDFMSKVRQGRFSNPYSHQTSINSQRANSKSRTPETNKLPKSPQSSATKPLRSQSIAIKLLPKLSNISQKLSVVQVTQRKLDKVQYELKLSKYGFEQAHKINRRGDVRNNQKKKIKKYQDENQGINSKLKQIRNHKSMHEQIQPFKDEYANIQTLQGLRQRQFFQQFKNRMAKYEPWYEVALNKRQKDKLTSQRAKNKARLSKAVEAAKQVQEDVLLEKVSFKISKFQDILAIQEQNFFQNKRNKQQFNIFKLIQDPDNIMFLSGRQQLKNLYFCIEPSLQTKNKNFNESIFKAISTFSRLAAINNFSKSIPNSFRLQQSDIAQKIEKQLKCQDILQLVNGQILPQMLLKASQNEISKNESQENVQEKDTNDEREAKLVGGGANWSKGQDFQLIYYNKLRMIQKQQCLAEKYKNNQLMLQDLMKEFLKLKKSNIEDLQTENKLTSRKAEVLRASFQVLGLNSQSARNEQKIREYKRKKDQIENFKISLIREQIRKLKECERFLKGKSHSKSRNKRRKTQHLVSLS